MKLHTKSMYLFQYFAGLERTFGKNTVYTSKIDKMRIFIENYLHFMKNCIRPPYEKLKPPKSGFIENSNFENNRDPCKTGLVFYICSCIASSWTFWKVSRVGSSILTDPLKLCEPVDFALYPFLCTGWSLKFQHYFWIIVL